MMTIIRNDNSPPYSNIHYLGRPIMTLIDSVEFMIKKNAIFRKEHSTKKNYRWNANVRGQPLLNSWYALSYYGLLFQDAELVPF